MRLARLTTFAALLLLITSCVDDDALPTAQPERVDIEPTEVATISPTEAGLIGSVYSTDRSNKGPLAGTEVRLAQTYWNAEQTEGAFVIDETASPVTFSDEDGKFVFSGLEPLDYVIVVGDLYGQNVIISNDDGSAKVFSTVLGQALDVGVLQVNLAAAEPFPTTPVDAYPPPSATLTPHTYP